MLVWAEPASTPNCKTTAMARPQRIFLDFNLNRPNAKTNAANETNKRPTGGSGTIVSTHTPGLADTDPSPTIPDASSRLPESTTSPESFSVWIPLVSAEEGGRKSRTSKFQETMAPDESVPKMLSCTSPTPQHDVLR